MPVSTPLSPHLAATTPSRSSGYLYSPSNNSSYTPTVVLNGHQKLNVVTRVAIEGNLKRGQDGASIRMFLKISLPLDSVTAGSTIPLFPEENVKIHSSQLHPLDQNFAPYNFSSTLFPFLHSAARALNLPARSQEHFLSALNPGQANGNTNSVASDVGENVVPIDVQYTGHILVSGYNIAFVLPKVFLPSRRQGGSSENDDDRLPRTPVSRGRTSLGTERNQAHFMAAIDMWVPLLSKPPRSPYLLSIPSPRCLHNHIKLRIFPPANNSGSYASLSSVEEDNNAWDLTSDPHVTRSVLSRRSRSISYTHFADDESSDSSNTGLTDGCVIQGTFPSAERIRVRWAKPTKNVKIPGEENGRRRVGVEDVKGEMVCTVMGKGTNPSTPDVQGVLLHVEYKSECKGVWFAGVATLLGLDVGLEGKGSHISWPQGYPNQWEVSGGSGFTGFDAGSTSLPNSRMSSLDSQIQGPSDSANAYDSTKTSSTSSTSSLLRAPLPYQNVPEYSFEGSNNNLTANSLSAEGTLSSLSSLLTSSTPNLPRSTNKESLTPITLHINMNDLQAKNTFTFSISGTVLVTSKASRARANSVSSPSSLHSGNVNDPEPIILPRFTVLAAESESTSMIIRNEVDGASVEVFHPNGDIHSDPQAIKTVLQRTDSTRCGNEGGRIVVRYFDLFKVDSNARLITRPRTPTTKTTSNSQLSRSSFPMGRKSQRDKPLVIPWVKATVTGLAPDTDMFPTGYGVRLILPLPALDDSEWLEFGMASEKKVNCDSADQSRRPKVHIICASIEGVPVRGEITKVARADINALAGGIQFEDLSEKHWICWGKVYSGGASIGDEMIVDYVVKDQEPDAKNVAQKPNKLSSEMNILLPTFFLSVARLEVHIDTIQGLDISFLRSNFDSHQGLPEGNRFLKYSLLEFSRPQLSLTIQKTSDKPALAMRGLKRYFLLTWAITFVAFYTLYNLMLDWHQSHEVENYLESWANVPTITVTSTVYRNSGARRWFGESAIDTSFPQPSATPTLALFPETGALSSTESQFTESKRSISSYDQETSLSDQPLLENYALIVSENIFSFGWFDNVHGIKRSFEKFMGTMEAVWNIFRKVYHYPLNPP